MKYIQSYYTDIGIKRKSNQDSIALLKADTEMGEVLLAVVCDGMGGYQLGELASKIIVKKYAKWFKERLPVILYDGMDFETVKRDWRDIVEDSNSLLVDYGRKNGIDLGSTVTAFLFVEDRYVALQIGDSRGYVIGDDVTQITQDHSLIAMEVKKGLLTEEEAKHDKRKNVLLECVGITPSVNYDYYEGKVLPNQTFLFCSDGLWHKIEKDEMKRYLSAESMQDNKKMRMHLNFLVQTAKERGEKDNISVIGITSI